MNLTELQEELKSYYREQSATRLGGSNYRPPVFDVLDDYAASHPNAGVLQLKVAQYEIIAEHFRPVIFRNTPFYSEMGMKVSEYDGIPGLSAGGWLFKRNRHLLRDVNPEEYDRHLKAHALGIHEGSRPYIDFDHHCFPYSNVLENGLGGIYAQAETELRNCTTDEEIEFIESTQRALLAVRKIADKFSLAAEALLPRTTDTEQARFLERIARTAREVPWRPAATFYEGLSAVWFLHEVCASIEGIGMSVIGHLDRMLGRLYQDDLAAGRLDRDEAYELLCRFLVHTDCKLALDKPIAESFFAQEQGDTLILGGCDKDGQVVCNDVTFMVLRAHHELNLIYPKLHCRISRNSPEEFLDAINRDFLSGRNVIAFLNDDSLIPALVKAGKRLEDARTYVAGGCWETILEGYEHSAGANCYFNLARIADLSIHEQADLTAQTGITCDQLDGAQDFEDAYRIVMGNVIRSIRQLCMRIGTYGCVWPQVNPAPFFSACLADCLKERRDYTAGGGRYNPYGFPLAGFAILVDSLLAVQQLCYERRRCTLAELLEAVRADWQGHDILRAEVLTLPHFGDDSPESTVLSRRILDDIYEQTRDLKNERGGPFQLALYNYRDVIHWRNLTRATPDGRRAGDYLTQGLTPSRLHPSGAITEVVNSAAALDLSQCPANSLLTVSLPLGKMNPTVLAQFEHAFAASGIGMLQMNCVNREELLDARVHPERHRDLIVRLYGYSARFINLTPEMQEEFISRTLFKTA